MHRFALRLVLLAALAVVALSSGSLTAQSMKKKSSTTVDLDGQKSQIYDFWKAGKAESPNLYVFTLPKELNNDKDAATLTIYPVTGSADDVIAGWKGQFTPPKGFKIDDVARTENFKVGNANVHKLLIQGDYNDNGKKSADYRMDAFVYEGKDKKYAVKLVGPFKTVGLHIPDMDAWMKAFK
jgi:hypothetical protein